jgi:hypothetical protein
VNMVSRKSQLNEKDRLAKWKVLINDCARMCTYTCKIKSQHVMI